MLHYRRLMDQKIFERRNELVAARVVSFVQDRGFLCAHSFLPIEKNREVNTWPIIKQLSRMSRKVVLSATDFRNETMSHYWYDGALKFEQGAFGIPVPINGAPADLSNVDMVLVPLLAADQKGNRIGYGKGYYDRLLAGMKKEVTKVGVTLAPLFDLFNFAESHDVRLDYCATPKEILKTND